MPSLVQTDTDPEHYKNLSYFSSLKMLFWQLVRISNMVLLHLQQGFLFTQISWHSPIKILKVPNISKLQDNFYIYQCLPFYIINEVGHLTTSVDHLAEFCQNYHLAAICTQLMVKFFLQLRFIQYFDCKCMKIPDFSRIDSHFVA